MRERTASIFRGTARRLAAAGAIGLLLAALGPFGTFAQLDWGPRLVFWVGTVGTNWLLSEAAVRAVARAARGALARYRVAFLLAAAVVVSLPGTAVVEVFHALVGLAPGPLAALYWKVLLLTAVIMLVVHRPAPAPADAVAPAVGGTPADEPPRPPGATGAADLFAQRMPPGLGGHLLWLEMEDHYLRIHTDEGQALILCRMEDAARELQARGLRVHRSYWVARRAVASSERDNGRLWLRLVDGRRIPVGKTYRAAVRAAGWLAAADEPAQTPG